MYISGATCPHSLRLPFPEHGRGKEESDGEREGASPPGFHANGLCLFQEGKASGVAAQTGGESPEAAGTRESSKASQQPEFPAQPPPSLDEDHGQIFAPIYSSKFELGSPLQQRPPGSGAHHTSVYFFLCPSFMSDLAMLTGLWSQEELK